MSEELFYNLSVSYLQGMWLYCLWSQFSCQEIGEKWSFPVQLPNLALLMEYFQVLLSSWLFLKPLENDKLISVISRIHYSKEHYIDFALWTKLEPLSHKSLASIFYLFTFSIICVRYSGHLFLIKLASYLNTEKFMLHLLLSFPHHLFDFKVSFITVILKKCVIN